MRFHLGYILGAFAIALAAGAGYISVVGWGKLFAGEATIVMIIMAIIESAKIVTTIYLHRYGKKTIPKKTGSGFFHFFKKLFSLKTYLVIGVLATMFLTSVGIYGFLTGAYQETANKMEIHDGEVGILEGKRDIFEQKITDNKEIKEDKSGLIDNLVQQRMQQQSRLDSLLINEHWQNAKRTREALDETNNQIKKLTQDIDTIVAKNSSLQDSVSTYQVQILELNSTSDVAAEIGPLKYISTLTGRPMDSTINWIVLVIIFIFDPMAICLVLASNKVFDQNARSDTSEDEPPNPPDDEPNKPTIIDGGGISGISPELAKLLYDKAQEMKGESQEDKMTEEIIEVLESDENIDIEPEPTETNEEPEAEGDDSPIEDELRPQMTEETRLHLEDVAYKLRGKELFKEKNERVSKILKNLNEQKSEEEEEVIDETKGNEGLDNELKKHIESIVKNSPEEQLVENKEEIEKLTEDRVQREEIKEIKQQKRPYSVDVPNPKNNVQRIGTNKEVRDGEKGIFYFNRPKQ